MVNSNPLRECIFCGKHVRNLGSHLLSHIKERATFCKFCSKECFSGQSYQTHIKIYHPEELTKKLSCPFCNKHYTLNFDFTIHLRIHTGEKPYSCRVCHKKFTSMASWRSHSKIHFVGKVHECDLCPKKFTNMASLRTHKSSVHQPLYKLFCPMCPKRFKTILTRNSHIKTHTNEKAYKCTVCEVSYKHASTLKQHFVRDHSGIRYKVNCTICGVETSPWDLSGHLATHTKPHKCPICEKGFAKKSKMEDHRKLHTGGRPKVFECGICGKTFDSRKGKKLHEDRHTSRLPCTICGLVFSCSSNLRVHMRRHTKQKPYCCVFCDKRFSEFSGLKSHILQHVGEKPWLCNECPYEARGSDQIKKHKLRYHSGMYKKPDKTHACSMCDMKFSWQGNLLRHLRFHTGEKPYKCSTCNKRYAKKLTRDDHVKKQHPSVKNTE